MNPQIWKSQTGEAMTTPTNSPTVMRIENASVIPVKFTVAIWAPRSAATSLMGATSFSKIQSYCHHPMAAPMMIAISEMTTRRRSSRRWSPRDILPSGSRCLRSRRKAMRQCLTSRVSGEPVEPSAQSAGFS